MGLPAINSLANMEYMLYGGASNLNGNCPSFSNGYMATNYANYNPAFMGGYGYGYNPAMSGYSVPSSVFTNPQTAAAAGAATAGLGAAAGSAAAGISQQDLNVLADYATKINEGGETFGGALMGGLTFAAFENPQNVKHPWNAIQGMKNANKIFDLKNANIKALWEGKETRELMQDAYSQAQAASRRLLDKKGWFSQMFARNLTPADKTYVEGLLKDLRYAMENNKTKDIAEITKKLEAARGIDGRIMTPINAITGKTNFSAEQRVLNAEKAGKFAEGTKALSLGTKFLKEAKGWFFFEALIEGATKVLPTYMEGGTDAGNKQLVQSGAKAAASAAGWSLGRLAGGALGAKAGAAIGTCFGPGVGTAIGAVIGFAGGCVGSWLANKGLKAIMGKDESEQLAEAKMKQTQEGQTQLLQLAYQKALTGEAPKEVVDSLNNVMRQVA